MLSSTIDFDSDLEFSYDDSDCYDNEISELYAYTEFPEFDENRDSFMEFLQAKNMDAWRSLDDEEQKVLLLTILQTADHGDKVKRDKAIQSLLYLAQGVFEECSTVAEQKAECRKCCFRLYQHGAFTVLHDLLLMEIQATMDGQQVLSNREKRAQVTSVEDSKQLRHILSIMYTMVETLRRQDDGDDEEMQTARADFMTDLRDNLNEKEQSLVVTLFSMVSKFCLMSCTNFPMRKVLLLIWKLILACLGGFRYLHETKVEKRKAAGLRILDEDPIEIVSRMQASNPPTSATDILEMNQALARGRRRRMMNGETEDDNSSSAREKTSSSSSSDDKKGVFEEEKVTSIDDSPTTDDDETISSSEGENPEEVEQQQVPAGVMTPAIIPKKDNSSGGGLETDVGSVAAKLFQIRKEQQDEMMMKYMVKAPTGLPWIPKACERDLQNFLTVVRRKFIGYSYAGDLSTVAGLPRPTQESVAVLKRHLYSSLSKLQIEKELEVSKYPFTVGKQEVIVDSPSERLYQALLVNLPKFMIGLLQILLAAAPTTKTKADSNSINVLTDVLPAKIPTSQAESVQLGVDVNRHREVIIKSISAIIILLLKHFKLNHVYQFEYTGQHLVFANCIPLILKFLNQGIVTFVTGRNAVPCLDFPQCVIGERTPLSADKLKGMDEDVSGGCWRNLFSSINLLRILNKLVKWKHSRTMMLVVFKSAPILKNALKVRHAMFQFYVLKLLKTQTKYLGRTWRKSNMKTLSDIYQKVRHHLNDDWAFGNDVDAEPWGFQQEEFALRTNVERFNIRRYKTTGHNGSAAGSTSAQSAFLVAAGADGDECGTYTPVNNDLRSLLAEQVELPYEFECAYQSWVEREVYATETEWDQLLEIETI